MVEGGSEEGVYKPITNCNLQLSTPIQICVVGYDSRYSKQYVFILDMILINTITWIYYCAFRWEIDMPSNADNIAALRREEVLYQRELD